MRATHTRFLAASAAVATSIATCSTPRVEHVQITGAAIEAEAERMRTVDTVAHECPPGSTECNPVDAPRVPRATGPVPVGAAGFELGMLESSAHAHCRGANETWSVLSRDVVACSGSAGKDLPFRVDLQICDPNVCRIILSQRVVDTWRALDRWRAVVADLARKYGDPGVRTFDVPPECQDLDAVGPCLASGLAKAEAEWAWSTGQTVSARLIAPSAPYVFLFVAYTDPAAARAVHVQGL